MSREARSAGPPSPTPAERPSADDPGPGVGPAPDGVGASDPGASHARDLLEDAEGGGGADAETVGVPPVVAVLVTRDPGPGLEESLRALAASGYPALTVLVLDDASAVDPTARIAAALPTAFVRRLPEPRGYAAAANEALGSVQGATFFLLCHDDAVVDPDALRLLVEEAYRSNAAIVGPKLVDYDAPDVLVEVGMAIDRFGVPHSDIEPGELDQEQHDAVRDVFFVSSTVMLVRADLFDELGGFDPATTPGAEDLDLCWRARVAGARVMVAPDARARRRSASPEVSGDEAAGREGGVDREGPLTDEQRLGPRARVRAMLKSYSGLSLAFVVPVGLVLALGESVALVVTGRRARARALLGGWTWNLRHLGDLRRARTPVQAARRVPDGDLRFLQVRGSTRVRSFVTGQLQAEARLRSVQERSRALAGTAGSRAREPVAVAVLAFALLALFGSRSLILGSVPVVGELQPWPGVSGLLDAFMSAWRSQYMGSPSPAPPLFALMASVTTVVLGAAGFARTLVVVGAMPLGAVGAWRLGRAITGRGPAAVAIGLAYGVNPLPRNAIAQGRLGPLVAYALAPFLATALLRDAGLAPGAHPRRLRRIVGIAALVAITTAAWPPALAFPLLLALAVALAAPFTGDRRAVLETAGSAALGTAAGLLLLLPWPFAFVGGQSLSAALGSVYPADFTLSEILRFETGPAGAGASGWVLLGAGLLVLLLGAGPRLAWAARGWMLALPSFALVWIPSALGDTTIPAAEGVLVPAALGLAIAVGLGVAVFADDVRRFHFGWRQVAAVAGGIALALPVLAFAADTLGGRWHLPGSDFASALEWMPAEADQGEFRVLWLGQADALPLDPSVRDGIAYGVTRNGPGDARVLLPPSATGGNEVLADAVSVLAQRRTNRVGQVLAPLGVRYLAVPERPSPGLERTEPIPESLARGLADQLDLSRLEAAPGLLLYENRAWLPAQAVVPAGRVPTGEDVDPITAALDTDLAGATAVGSSPAPGGTITLAESYADAWSASRRSRTVEHEAGFGWLNAYPSPQPGRVGFAYTAQWQRYPMVLLELALVLAAWIIWRGGVPRLRRRATHDEAEAPSP